MFWRRSRLRISPLQLQRQENLSRVTADVDGRPLWFESEQPLTPAPEAFAGLFWIPALDAGRPLLSDSPLDPHWIESACRTLPVLHRWWGYRDASPLAAGQRTTARGMEQAADAGRRTGLCFTCGVDSFHALLCGGIPVDTLVFAHGYDIPHDDWPRRQTLERSLRDVAGAQGKRLVVIRSNLRTHPTFARVSWNRTHGSALAALGHLLGDSLARLVIPSSYSYELASPWGSSWELDPHWSSPRVEVIHEDASTPRPEKIFRIAGHPLVQPHLQVCWSRKSATGNCCRCEKCLRTMVVCQAAGRLDSLTAFAPPAPLHELLQQSPPLARHLFGIWQEIRTLPVPAPTAAAIDALLARSGSARSAD